MALFCRKIGFIEPFAKRQIYKDLPEAPHAAGASSKSLDQRLAEKTKESEALEKKIKELEAKIAELKNAVKTGSKLKQEEIKNEVEKTKESLDGKRKNARAYFKGLSNDSEMEAGKIYKVDFKGDSQAELTIGLKDMTPPSVKEITVYHREKGKLSILNGKRYEGSDTKKIGKFYTSSDNYVSIWSGDQVVVGKTDKVSAEVAPKVATPTTDTIRKEISGRRIHNNSTTSATIETLASATEPVVATRIDTAVASTAAAEAEVAAKVEKTIDELSRKDKAKIPEELKGNSKFFYGDNFRNMDYGTQVMNALDTLRASGGFKGTETDMWEAIRRQNGGKDSVGFAEICRAVLNTSPEKVMEEYEYLKKNPALKDQLEKMETFLLASKDLLEGVENLKYKRPVMDVAPENRSNEVMMAEDIISKVFDPTIEGPTVKMSALRKLFAKDKNPTISMQTYTEKAKYTNELDRYMSEKSAFTQLREAVITSDEDGRDKVNFNHLAMRLEELRLKGLVASAADPDLMKEIEKNPEAKIALSEARIKTLSPTQISLIRYGMMIEQGEKFAQNKLEERNFLLKPKDGAFAAPTAEVLQQLASKFSFTNEELAEYGKQIETELIGMAGLIGNTVEKTNVREREDYKVNYVNLGLDKTIPLYNGALLHLGVSNKGLAIGISGTHQQGRLTTSEIGGVFANKDTVYVGVGEEVTIALDKYKEWAISLGAGAAIDVNTDLSQTDLFKALMLGANVGLSRRMEGAAQRKIDKLSEQQRSAIEAKLGIYKDTLLQGMSEEQKVQYLTELHQFYKDTLASEATQDMKDFQPTDVGIAVGGGRFGPYFMFVIKGKEYVSYARPEKLALNPLAEKEMLEDIKRQTGSLPEAKVIYVSGELQINAESGLKTISDAAVRAADIATDRMTDINSRIADKGLRLEKAGDKVALTIGKTYDSNVDIYTDPTSRLETVTGSGNDALINLGTTEALHIYRVDQHFPFNESKHSHRVKIYITDRVLKDGDLAKIEADSKSRIHYEVKRGLARSTATEIVEGSKGIDKVMTQVELAESGLDEKFFQDMEKVNAARSAMRDALNQEKLERVSTDRKAVLDGIAANVLKKYPIDYRKISLGENFDAAQIDAYVNEFAGGQTFNNLEKTYLIQALMMQALAKEPKGLEKHIKEWNKKMLKKSLLDKGVNDSMAENISEKVMDYYLKQLESGTYPKSKIAPGSIVQIQVGTKKIEGYREAFYQPREIDELAAPVTLSPETLSSILSPEESAAFINAMTERLSPLGDSPAELMQSQLGLAVLDASEIIFGAEATLKLAEVVKNPALATDFAHSEIFKQYEKIVRDLRANGKVEYRGFTLSVKTSKEMALHDQCKNFTLLMNEKLSITLPVTESGKAQVEDYLRGRTGAKFFKFGFALSYRTVDKTHKLPPEKDKKAGKDNEETGGNDDVNNRTLDPWRSDDGGGQLHEEAGDHF